MQLTVETNVRAPIERGWEAYTTRLHVVSCGKQHCHWGIAGANGLAGRCLSLDMRR